MADIAPGTTVTATMLNRLRERIYSAVASADLVGAGAASAAITGATVTFTTDTANAEAEVEATFDFDHSASTSTVATGELFLDGTKQGGECVYQQGTASANDRMTPGSNWVVPLGTAGSKTLDLRATAPTGITVHQTNTRFKVKVREVVA